jgi:hypothetical protein
LQVLKLAVLFLVACAPSFGTVITGGYVYVNESGASFELKSATFDVSGSAFDFDGFDALTYGNPYAVASPIGFLVNAGYGTVNGVYYPDLYFSIENGPPPPSIPFNGSGLEFAGPLVYGTTATVTAPFTLTDSALNLFLLGSNPMCLECNLKLQGGGTVTFNWNYNPIGNLYSAPDVIFAFSAAPEPSTCLLFAAGLVALLCGIYFRKACRNESMAAAQSQYPRLLG